MTEIMPYLPGAETPAQRDAAVDTIVSKLRELLEKREETMRMFVRALIPNLEGTMIAGRLEVEASGNYPGSFWTNLGAIPEENNHKLRQLVTKIASGDIETVPETAAEAAYDFAVAIGAGDRLHTIDKELATRWDDVRMITHRFNNFIRDTFDVSWLEPLSMISHYDLTQDTTDQLVHLVKLRLRADDFHALRQKPTSDGTKPPTEEELRSELVGQRLYLAAVSAHIRRGIDEYGDTRLSLLTRTLNELGDPNDETPTTLSFQVIDAYESELHHSSTTDRDVDLVAKALAHVFPGSKGVIWEQVLDINHARLPASPRTYLEPEVST